MAYREAITRPAEVDYTHKKQSGGSGQFARIKMKFVPTDMDEDGATSDFEFVSEIKGGVVPKEYIPGVQKVRKSKKKTKKNAPCERLSTEVG